MLRKLIVVTITVVIITAVVICMLSMTGCGGSNNNTSPTPPPAPPAPSFLTVTAADKQLTIEWITVYGATGYEVWYSMTNDPLTATQVTQKFTGTTCIITGLTNGTPYFVWIASKNEGGTSDFSSVGTGTPISATNRPEVPNIPTLKGGDKEITVIWNSVAGATSYEVWYSTKNDTSSATKSTNTVTGTGSTITGLTNGTTYYVWVKAMNSAGISDFSSGSQVILEVIYNGSIRGLVTSSGNYSVILVEQNKVQNFYTTNQYFYFNNLPPGTYHVRVERTGYEGILKEVYLAQDAIMELGTINADANPLPNGSGFGSSSIRVSSDNVQSITDYSRDFTIPQHAISATLTYLIKPISNMGAGTGEFKRISPSPYVYFNRNANLSALSGSVNFTDLMAGTYHVIIYCLRNDGSYLNLVWNYDNGGPKVEISKTWGNSTDAQEIYVSCSDSLSGLKSIQYYVSKITVKPTNFNDMMANYNVQIIDKGTWYLHVQATDNENNVNYRCVGPFIIQ